MADINFSADARDADQDDARTSPPREPDYELIELLFFAYRDFVAEADHVLEAFGFGRAHHRVLHFVDRNPGLTVAELLDILNITKQSLGRVLKELVEQGFVIQREGPHDRRRRLLATTARGHRLALSLATLQSDRVRAALAQAGPAGHAAAARFLFGLVDPRGRATVQRLVRGGAGQEE